MAISDLVHNVETRFHLFLTFNSSRKLNFSYLRIMPGNYSLQFPGHHSYFRKYFQMLLALNMYCLHIVHFSNIDEKINQRTNGPVNAHLISWPSRAKNIQPGKYMVKKLP